jgi:Zn-dependent protease
VSPTLLKFLLVAPILLFSMVAHEVAHGYAAYRQGDDTAHVLGRLSWNPLRHIDPFMTVLLPMMLFLVNAPFIFGGAKPVPVDPSKYRSVRRGDIIVSMAGIVTNLLIAVLLVPAIVALGMLGRGLPAINDTLALVQVMFLLGVTINLALATFNLIPIPPLDGSHVMKYLLPMSWAVQYQRVARYGFFLLVALLSFGRPVLMIWFTPMLKLNAVAADAVFPYLLTSPWTT